MFPLIRATGTTRVFPAQKKAQRSKNKTPDLGNAIPGSCHKRQKPQAPTPQAPIRNRETRKVANAKGLNRNTNLT